ncbi:alpha/beta hydrolase [Rhodococcus antarcticus]|uniref:Alpha/beta hydrolase n=1 Tax=Rhodococcus antarcticus TaxID=2987751 RepID=A0ABY6P2L3_9NOCA|nr:alpha/beta hydrolase [Rhodococcus antarcticus]UZJ25882.1 alpha/beta hydrolase [Rhodococcus antarcticus]
MTVSLRVRLADLVRRRAGGEITSMSAADIATAQTTHVGHSRVRDLVFGRVAEGVAIEDRVVAARSGDLRVRLYSPTGRTPRGCVVNLHGGGWVLGDLDGNDWTCSTVAARTGAQVVSVDYRLAPTHRFPAGVEDCLDGLRWAAELASSSAGIVVMGDSAGGNLAAALALASRDQGSPGIALQVLIYPGTDLTKQSPSLVENAEAPFLTKAGVDAFTEHYLGPGGDPRDPLASPLLAPDHTGLPPALILTAEHDPIRDDGRRYAAVLREAGVPVRHTDYVDAPHGFLSVPGLVPAGKQAIAEICAEITAVLR